MSYSAAEIHYLRIRIASDFRNMRNGKFMAVFVFHMKIGLV